MKSASKSLRLRVRPIRLSSSRRLIAGVPGPLRVAQEQGIEGEWVGELEVLRLVDGAFELVEGQDGREVEEGAAHAGDGDVVVGGGLVGREAVTRGCERPARCRRRDGAVTWMTTRRVSRISHSAPAW